MTPIRLTIDAVFKLFFTRESNADILAEFICSIMDIPPGQLDEIEVLNPYIDKEGIGDKDFIVDLRIRLASGARLHVEMQSQNHTGFEDRVAAYNGRMFGAGLKKGQHYAKLLPVYSIIITDFILIPNTGRYHDLFMYTNQDGAVFTNKQQIHLIQLPKVPDNPQTEKQNWLRLLKAEREDEFDMLAEKSGVMQKAVLRIRELSADEKARQLEEERVSAISLRETLIQQGVEQGIERGIEQGQALVAKNLLADGMSAQVVARLSGLSEQQVLSISRPPLLPS